MMHFFIRAASSFNNFLKTQVVTNFMLSVIGSKWSCQWRTWSIPCSHDDCNTAVIVGKWVTRFYKCDQQASCKPLIFIQDNKIISHKGWYCFSDTILHLEENWSNLSLILLQILNLKRALEDYLQATLRPDKVVN